MQHHMVPYITAGTKINIVHSESEYAQLQTDHRWHLCSVVGRIYFGNALTLCLSFILLTVTLKYFIAAPRNVDILLHGTINRSELTGRSREQ